MTGCDKRCERTASWPYVRCSKWVEGGKLPLKVFADKLENTDKGFLK